MRTNDYNLEFYLAADAVMYLPIFLAKEKGLFDNLVPDHNIKVSLNPASGDKDAIFRMNEANKKTNSNTVAIAIADPNAMAVGENSVLEEARAIGTLIGCPSFWGVSSQDNECEQTGIKNTYFSTIVHYGDNLITGYRIGSTVYNQEGIESVVKVKRLGQEFKELLPDHIIITPDLLNVAINCVNQNAYINYHFAKDTHNYISTDYLTTAIITSNRCIQDKIKNEILVKVIVAIQTAKAIIYSSDIIAREILADMNCIKNCKLDEKKASAVAKQIIEIIVEDHLYPYDFNISPQQWSSTTTEALKQGFSKYVDNDIVLQAERIIAEQFGITIEDTFAETIDEKIAKPLKEEIARLEKEMIERTSLSCRLKKWLKNNLFFVISLVLSGGYAVVWLIANYVYKATWTGKDFPKALCFSICLPILIRIFSLYLKRPESK